MAHSKKTKRQALAAISLGLAFAVAAGIAYWDKHAPEEKTGHQTQDQAQQDGTDYQTLVTKAAAALKERLDTEVAQGTMDAATADKINQGAAVLAASAPDNLKKALLRLEEKKAPDTDYDRSRDETFAYVLSPTLAAWLDQTYAVQGCIFQPKADAVHFAELYKIACAADGSVTTAKVKDQASGVEKTYDLKNKVVLEGGAENQDAAKAVPFAQAARGPLAEVEGVKMAVEAAVAHAHAGSLRFFHLNQKTILTEIQEGVDSQWIKAQAPAPGTP